MHLYICISMVCDNQLASDKMTDGGFHPREKKSEILRILVSYSHCFCFMWKQHILNNYIDVSSLDVISDTSNIYRSELDRGCVFLGKSLFPLQTDFPSVCVKIPLLLSDLAMGSFSVVIIDKIPLLLSDLGMGSFSLVLIIFILLNYYLHVMEWWL